MDSAPALQLQRVKSLILRKPRIRIIGASC